MPINKHIQKRKIRQHQNVINLSPKKGDKNEKYIEQLNEG